MYILHLHYKVLLGKHQHRQPLSKAAPPLGSDAGPPTDVTSDTASMHFAGSASSGSLFFVTLGYAGELGMVLSMSLHSPCCWGLNEDVSIVPP